MSWLLLFPHPIPLDPRALQIIIVGVDNTVNRTYELTYSVDPTVGVGGGADLYLDFIQYTVLPLVQSRYRIIASDPVTPRWGLLGSSLGGLVSCYAGWTRPDTYWFTGCMSSSFWWNSEDFNNTILERHNAHGCVSCGAAQHKC